MPECEQCGYSFRKNAPGVDMTEAPWFTHRTKYGTKYLCSSVCMRKYLKGCDYTEPKGDSPPYNRQ